jgi:hypothetical protein
MEKINELYKNRGYFERYGGDVCISIGLVIATLLITGYTGYQSMMAQVKTNWNQNRCNPIYMPFAGIIMPQPGATTAETTGENFAYCIKQDASAVFSIALMPFEFAMYVMIEFIDAVLSAIMAIMAFIQWLKDQLGGIFAKIYNKIVYFIVPLIEMIIHMRDMIAKLNGVALTALYTAMNIYNLTISGILNIMVILNNLLIATIAIMLGMIVLAFILIPTPVFPLGLGIYIAGFAIFTSFVIPVVVLYTLMKTFTNEIFKTSAPEGQSTPKIKKRRK